MYRAGASTPQIHEETGASLNKIRRTLKAAGEKLHRNKSVAGVTLRERWIANVDIRGIEMAIKDEWPVTEISETFSVSAWWLYKRYPELSGRGRPGSLGPYYNLMKKRVFEGVR